MRFKSSCFSEFQFVNKSEQGISQGICFCLTLWLKTAGCWRTRARDVNVLPTQAVLCSWRVSGLATNLSHILLGSIKGIAFCVCVFSFLKTAIALSSDRMWSFIVGYFKCNIHQLNSKGLLGRNHHRYFLCVTLQKMAENAFTLKSLAFSTNSHILWFY